MKLQLLSVVLLGALASSLPSQADETKFDLEQLTCFEVISLSEDDSLFVTALLLGYSLGLGSASETSSTVIQAQVEAFDRTCGENPEMLAHKVVK